ncbi:cytosine permease [Nonomuraea sp. NPDC049607]|uniref:cytosine permease n=1 Tax=Nonomuraea sp. NPDC049607 TaxID=3154732 RepID=UPI00342B269A
MTTETPAERAQAATGAPGYRIALILLGIIITPVVLSSPTLGSGLPFPSVVTSVVAGSLVLMVVAVLTLAIGEHARQPTYDVVRFPFGRGGAKAITALLGVSVFGWATVTANGFGTAAQRLVAELTGAQVPLPVLVASGCVLFVAATAFGFEILGKVAQFAVPVIALLLGYLVHVSLSSARDFVTPGSPMDWGVAVSSVVGTGTVLAVTSADFGSFARGRRQALTGGVLAFGIAYPLLFVAGAVPAALTGRTALIDAMALIASALPAIALLVFASITANAGNIFQGTLAVSSLVPKARKWQVSIALGAGAAVLGSFDVSAWLPNFLLFLGIAAPPVAGIIIADFLLYRRNGYDTGALSYGAAVRLPTFVAWAGGSVVGYLTAYGTFSLTHIPSIDSLLCGGLLYALITALATSGRRERVA